MRIDKVLLELDPRKDNSAAMERARAIATSTGAAVDVLVCEPPPVMSAAPTAEPVIVAMAQNEYRAGFEEWAAAKASELGEAGIAVDVTVTAEQPRYEAILARADASGAGLVIRTVGEHGKLKRLFVGTTDWDLIRHAKRPLWLVQPEGTGRARSNVMAAVDPLHPRDEDMKLDKRLLDFADGLGKALAGSLHVYHAYQVMPTAVALPSGAALTPPAPRMHARAHERVEAAHKAALDQLLSGRELADERVHVLEGDPAANIDEVIEANEIGIVVAGAISRSWLDRLLVGSTAESFLDVVSCDLVLLKAGS